MSHIPWLGLRPVRTIKLTPKHSKKVKASVLDPSTSQAIHKNTEKLLIAILWSTEGIVFSPELQMKAAHYITDVQSPTGQNVHSHKYDKPGILSLRYVFI